MKEGDITRLNKFVVGKRKARPEDKASWKQEMIDLIAIVSIRLGNAKTEANLQNDLKNLTGSSFKDGVLILSKEHRSFLEYSTTLLNEQEPSLIKAIIVMLQNKSQGYTNPKIMPILINFSIMVNNYLYKNYNNPLSLLAFIM